MSVRPSRHDASYPDYAGEARRRLSQFRNANILAVAATGLLFALWISPAPGRAQAPTMAESQAATSKPNQSGARRPSSTAASKPATEPSTSAVESAREAAGEVHNMWTRALAWLPRLGIAIIILFIAALIARVVRWMVRRGLRSWERKDALSAILGVVIVLLAVGIALSIIAGDARALVGSIGLTGLALSWALQTPIESFTGWLLNSFKLYYRVGDRIRVGEIFGDVYTVDFLTTTIWEAGGPGKAVQGSQPTGALITFPNLEVLRSNIINYTRAFPYVWDEVTFGVGNDSDLAYAMRTIQEVAKRLLGDRMRAPVAKYRHVLGLHQLELDVADEPQVYVALAESWTNISVRYVVPTRERRQWASELTVAVTAEMNKPEHARRIKPSYPRSQVELLNPPSAEVHSAPGRE